MGAGRSKPQHGSHLHIGMGEAHAAHTDHIHHGAVVHHDLHHHQHTGGEGVAHNALDFTHELFSKRVQEGDTLWHLSEKYLGDGNKWPYLQAACELDRDPHRLLPGRPITHHCIHRAKEDAAKHHHPHYVNPSSNPLHRGSRPESRAHPSEHHGHENSHKNPLHRAS